VGRVTSAAFSPRLRRALALGYVARAAAEPGTRATLIDGDRQATAEIIALAG
jgi:glycine cleavage system aminomethyltransferase T